MFTFFTLKNLNLKLMKNISTKDTKKFVGKKLKY